MAKSLFDKTYIGKMKLKNRIFMSPMGTTGEADGAYVPEEVEEYVALDIGLIGPDYHADEKTVSICAKDNYSPYDRELTTRIINQDKKNKLKLLC